MFAIFVPVETSTFPEVTPSETLELAPLAVTALGEEPPETTWGTMIAAAASPATAIPAIR